MIDPIPFMIEQSRAWVKSERGRHRSTAFPLAPQDRAFLGNYFASDLLDTVRVKIVPELYDPPFFDDLVKAGFPRPPLDFRLTSGITFIDTVLISQSCAPAAGPWAGLILHEIAHVVQYRLLGADEFLRQYVLGAVTAHGLDYAAIPLEIACYEVQFRFLKNPSESFSIEEEMRRRFKDGGPIPT